MRAIVFKADLFSSERDRARSEQVLLILLSALVESNLAWLREHPNTPPLYRTGVRYKSEEGTEIWRSIPDLYQNGEGDCEDLTCARVAELRKVGIMATPMVTFKRKGDFCLYHVKVRYPDGKTEDPSLALGMGKDE